VGIASINRTQPRHPKREFTSFSLTVLAETDICRAALETGALGYALKSRFGTDLIPALKLATAGSRFVSRCCETPD